jgi:hypothetical protein
VKNGNAQNKSPTSGIDNEQSKVTFLDIAVGKINEMFPHPAEREFKIIFLPLLPLSRVKLYLKFKV